MSQLMTYPGVSVTQCLIIVIPRHVCVTCDNSDMTHDTVSHLNTRHNSHPDYVHAQVITELLISRIMAGSWVITFQTRCKMWGLRCPFGIIIAADLAHCIITPVTRGLTEICQPLTDLQTTAVWVSPTTSPKCCWGRLITNNNTVILSQADMTVTTRDRIIGTREWAGRLRFIRSENH